MNCFQVWHKCTPGRQHGDDGCKLFFLWSVNSHLSVTEKEYGALVVIASMLIHGIYMTQTKMGEEGGEEHVDQTAALQRGDWTLCTVLCILQVSQHRLGHSLSNPDQFVQP